MLERETIKTLRLIPEVDLDKATTIQFTNSDKRAAEVNLGNNPETFRAAFQATKVALDLAYNAQSPNKY